MLDFIKGVALAITDFAAHQWLWRGAIKDHPFFLMTPPDRDYRGIPTAECMCGNRVFHMVVWFDDDYELAGYETTGQCAECGALVTVCTPLDLPESERY